MSTTENDNHGACMDQLGRTVRVGTPRTSIPRQTCRWCVVGARSGEMSTDAFIVPCGVFVPSLHQLGPLRGAARRRD